MEQTRIIHVCVACMDDYFFKKLKLCDKKKNTVVQRKRGCCSSSSVLAEGHRNNTDALFYSREVDKLWIGKENLQAENYG